MSRDGRRSLRVAEIARAELASAVRRRLDDPGFALLVVTRVTVSDDLSVFDFGVRFSGISAPEERNRLYQRLKRALPRLQREVVPRLSLRRAPMLRIHLDEGEDAAQRVEEILAEIASDPKSE